MLTPLEKARIAIVGAGPTGLGAAHRLTELGLTGFQVYEQSDYPGGLAASFTDQSGFTWDIGGHVQFSHYEYFDSLMDRLLGGEWLHHQRESWIWIRERFVPYPLQNNIHRLPEEELRECLRGLIRLRGRNGLQPPHNFAEWIEAGFGEGIARIFLLPYNFKVWAYPPSELSHHWVGERVATVDLERVLFNVLDKRDDAGWGPNNTFRFPAHGGTGEIWRRLAACLPSGSVRYGKRLERVDTKARRLTFADGGVEDFDVLVSTIPLDQLIGISDLDHLKDAAASLRYSTVHIIGIGLDGAPPPDLTTKCWMYFPEDTSPFYRATLFSNYSPNNVPDSSRHWSLMVEISESPVKPVERERVVEDAVEGALRTRLIESRSHIRTLWSYTAGHGYPTPFLGRDQVVDPLIAELEQHGVFSRGRFGAWKYEVSNQDHSLMQGVEIVNRLAFKVPEVTLRHPEVVNHPR